MNAVWQRPPRGSSSPMVARSSPSGLVWLLSISVASCSVRCILDRKSCCTALRAGMVPGCGSGRWSALWSSFFAY